MIFNCKKAYLIGIKGTGMTALAKIMKDLGINIVGSDVKKKFFTDEVLKHNKINFYEGFSQKNLKKELPVDIVISSVAYFQPGKKTENPELKFAQKNNIPIITYPQAVAEIFNQSFGIAVCGSHGKSSTTAILGKVFKDMGFDPTVLVGSEVIEWKSNSLVSENFKKKINFLNKNESKLNNLDWLRKNLKKLPIFIIEADEYRDAFLNYRPRIIIITNIDYDHPDYFKTAKNYQQSFYRFILNLQSPKILIYYKNEIKRKILDKSIRANSIYFSPSLSFPFPFPGTHFQKNLQLIHKLIKILNLSDKKFIKSLRTYKGIKRRFEIIGHFNKIYLIDDYAHHPTEVLSYFKSLKIAFPYQKIFFIFQPHTFTRTHFLFKEFKKVFSCLKKDSLTFPIIYKTFASAREKTKLLKIKNLKKDIFLAQTLRIPFFNNKRKLVKFLEEKLSPDTIITTVGAGDVYKILDELIIKKH
ncbi:MAG: UDP-N-acetylmuramate--L-alanine ligase [Candidatus Parcubacteria bacterium]|nr:MAG: UDP-N-acetylmuramate--L-alanine ligase [Candidatus Parcubacteria bacterium]